MAASQSASASAGSNTVQTPVLRLRLPSGTLRLRAEPAEERHIQWAEDVIDNEGMGKKSSKVCCVYHKPRPYDQSSDESSSDSSESDSDSEPDNSTARPVGGRRGGRPQGRKPHDHHHNHDHNGEGSGGNRPKRSQAQPRKRAPNAYEKVPKKR